MFKKVKLTYFTYFVNTSGLKKFIQISLKQIKEHGSVFKKTFRRAGL
jgi:hypothetical protein